MIRRPSVLVTVLLLLLSPQLLMGLAVATSGDPEPDHVPGQLIVSFNPGVTAEEIAEFYEEYDMVEEEDLDSDEYDDDPEEKLVESLEATRELIAELEKDPRVDYVEFNYILSSDVIPNDTLFGDLWGLHNLGQTGGTADADIDAPEAWDITTGSSAIIVGVIDTGVNYDHQDLAASVWTNPGETGSDANGNDKSTNGIDDDGNGYIDDVHGINTITNAGDPRDDNGHGTHVAGTIGAVGDNGIGVVGVSWTVDIAACKFLSSSGSGTTANAVKCFKYFNHLKNQLGQNVLVTSNSWGGGGFSQALRDAMAGLDQPGMVPILHATAAGNSNSDNDADPHYPSSYDLDNIIAVAAADHDDLYPSFSSYGATSVDLAAPGVSILSTDIPGNSYSQKSGTSMATPHVAGAVALVWSAYPGLTASQVKQRILSSTDNIGDSSKSTLTNGRLNVLKALESDTAPPAAVTDLATSGSTLTSVTLTWTATGDDGLVGTASSYDIRYSTSLITDANWVSASQAAGEPTPQSSGSAETFAVTGLTSSTTYYFALKVIDNAGLESGLSNVVTGSTSTNTIIFEDNMENGIGGWTSTGLWRLSTHRSNTPSTAWYYGQEGVWNYDTGGKNSGTLTSPAIDLTGATEALLTFYEWSELESWTSYDRTRVQVSTDGVTWLTVFESHGTNNAWVKRTVDLAPYVGGNVYVRFWFDTIDGIFNTYEGWYVDDVGVVAALSGPPNQAPIADAGPDQSGNEGSFLAFNGSASSDPDGTITSYNWSFGDGATGSGVTTTHTYADNGTYTVTLAVTDDLGATGTDTAVVTVYNVAPTAEAGGPYASIKGSPITFSGSATDPGAADTHTFQWAFGDGGTAIGQTVSHTYAVAGNYVVTLTVTDKDGASGSDTSNVAVSLPNQPPVANAGANQVANEGDLVSFDGSASYDPDGAIVSYAWDFGDGSTGVGVAPSHTYAQQGIYLVTLTVSDGSLSDTDTATTTVYDTDPVADYLASPTTGLEPLAVSFTDASISYDGLTSLTWEFGDGSTSTVQNPVHTYSQDGSYSVSLTVSESDGDTSTVTKVGLIVVSDTSPVADFTASPVSGPAPLTVNFADLSTSYDGITAWQWDFDNDGVVDSTQQNPSHAYELEGVYSVALTVQEGDGDTATETKNFITVTASNAPPAASANGLYSGTEGIPISLKSTGSSDPDGMIVSYFWDFGDGATSTQQNPAHTYGQDGIYTVILTVTDNDGATGTDTTTATIADIEPTVDFSATPNSGTEPLTVSFTVGSTSYDGIISWEWDFNSDGLVDSAQKNPTFTYAAHGTYTVTLKVKEADGDTASAVKLALITVSDSSPTASFSFTPTIPSEGDLVSFDASTSTGYDQPLSYFWDFGDGETGVGVNPSNVYADNGVYTVTLTVTDNDGDISTKIASVSVSNVAPIAEAEGPYSGTVGSPITFSGIVTDPGAADTHTYQWDFGDGGTATGQTVSHTYSVTGSYAVMLTVTDKDGGSGSDTAGVTVSPEAAVYLYREIFTESSPDNQERGVKVKVVVWIENQGQAVTNVKINEKFDPEFLAQGDPSTDSYSKGSQYLDSNKDIVWDVGSLAPGEVQFMSYWLYLPTVSGTYSVRSDLSYSGKTYSDIVLSTVDSRSTTGEFDFVWASIDHPKEIVMGEPLTLELAISNLGKNSITSGEVSLRIPDGWDVLDISDSGEWDSTKRTITWDISLFGPLEEFKDESYKTQVEVKPTKSGSYTFTVDATGVDSGGNGIDSSKDLRYVVEGQAAQSESSSEEQDLVAKASEEVD